MCCERCDKYDECEYKNESCCWECDYYEECYGEDVDILDDDEEEEDCDDYAYDDPCWYEDEDEDD
jgi:hypothetical protein